MSDRKLWSDTVAVAPPSGATVLRASLERPVEIDGRRAIYVASDPSVGRDNHTIAAGAWDTTHFERNPVFLWAHDSSQPPIGRVDRVWTSGERLMASVRYPDAGTYPFADTIYSLVRGGFLNAVSTGWRPLDWRRANDPDRPGGLDFTRVEMLELSQVPVPALPTALAAARSAGIGLRPLLSWAERQLDAPTTPIDRKDLTMIRKAAGAPRTYPVAAPTRAPARPTAPVPASPASPRWRNFGEFCRAVAATADGRAPEARLVRAPTGLGEVDPSKGGFLVPIEYVEDLVKSIFDEESVIAPWLARIRLDKPEAFLPAIDETSRADGSRWGGATSYWVSEGDTVTSTLPKFRKVAFSAHKLIGLCVATNELMADASVFSEYVRRAFSADMAFRLDGAILQGTGAGVPLGLLASPALITQAKDSGQTSGTITPTNIDNMWSNLPVPSRRRALWLASEKVEAALAEAVMTLGALPAGLGPMYMPMNGAAGNPYPMVKGRPLLTIEQGKPIGTPGDIVLFDPTAYALATMDPVMAISAEIDWSTDQTVLRLVWRIDGKPLYGSAVTSYSDGTLRSPFVALAQR